MPGAQVMFQAFQPDAVLYFGQQNLGLLRIGAGNVFPAIRLLPLLLPGGNIGSWHRPGNDVPLTIIAAQFQPPEGSYQSKKTD